MPGTLPKKDNIGWELAEEILAPDVFRHLKNMFFMFQKNEEEFREYATSYLTKNMKPPESKIELKLF